jgi:ubiquinone/menaquinone biosynthesis C-methylase UbiE
MAENSDWIWEILACPECGRAVEFGEGRPEICCSNESCGYVFRHDGRFFNLLPRVLDEHQAAEHAFRTKNIDRLDKKVAWMDEVQLAHYRLLNVATFYTFTSQYQFFRDIFAGRFDLQGRGLEIGGGTGHQSGFIKFFYPQTQMITSDVAPINLERGLGLAEMLGFTTDYFVLADAERIPFQPESFDFLFSSGMLHHLGDLPRALAAGYQALKPAGRWYVINELSIGSLARWFWNGRWGKKGQVARQTGIRENSYTFQEWRRFFLAQGFEIVDVFFPTASRYKLVSWSNALYYALIDKLPTALLKMGLPCEVNFVLEKA